uniref:Uncharacterized protein n=1 Tax=Amphimedon queenslandica TaxID=400682 RepID=A0A1X7V7H2_AMPQE
MSPLVNVKVLKNIRNVRMNDSTRKKSCKAYTTDRMTGEKEESSRDRELRQRSIPNRSNCITKRQQYLGLEYAILI